MDQCLSVVDQLCRYTLRLELLEEAFLSYELVPLWLCGSKDFFHSVSYATMIRTQTSLVALAMRSIKMTLE